MVDVVSSVEQSLGAKNAIMSEEGFAGCAERYGAYR
jgi:hypothetical protein